MTGLASRIVLSARRIASLFFLAVVVAACGGGDSEPPPAAHQPTISNLRYSPATATQVPGGTATINGTFDFSDAGGDVASVRITSSGGVNVSTPTPQLAGIAAGTVMGQVIVSVDQPGKYSFEFWVTDSAGMTSNRLTGTFEVTAAPVDHTPRIANLKSSPAFADQALGGVALLSGSVDFEDVGGDLARIDVVTSWGAVEHFSTLEFRGATSGSVKYNLVVPASQAGLLTFEMFAVDDRGSVSNKLGGAIEIRPLAPGSHVPAISNLGYAPASVFQTQSTVQSVSWSFAFSDSLGDIVRVWITGSGLEQSIEVPALNGVVAGTASGTVSFSTAQVGKFPFEVWAVDRSGNASNRLSGTFEVWPPDTWTKLPVVPAAPLNGIAWNGRYVAVGAGGTVMESPDLASWSTRSIGPDFNLASVAASPSRFVTVGGSAGSALVATSTDAGVWSVAYRASVPSTLTKVIWGGNQFVAVGCEFVSATVRYALFLTSPDGVTWTQQAPRQVVIDAEMPACGMKSVAWSGSVFVASGRDVQWSPTLWRSADAVSWVLAGDFTNAVVWTGLYDLAWGNGRFVAVGPSSSTGDAPAFTSVDGITWTTDTVTGPLPEMVAVTAGPGSFVAVGPSYRQTSPDGFNWTPVPMTGCGNAVTSDGVRFVAVGSSICRSQ